jgi:hypothetical protein
MLASVFGCGGGESQYMAATRPLVEQYKQAVTGLVEFEKAPYSSQQVTLDFYQKYSQDMASIKTDLCMQSKCVGKKMATFHSDFVKLLDIADLMAQSISTDLLRYQTVIAGTKFKNAGQRKNEVQMVSDKWENKVSATREAYISAHAQMLALFQQKYNIAFASIDTNPLITDLKKTFK